MHYRVSTFYFTERWEVCRIPEGAAHGIAGALLLLFPEQDVRAASVLFSQQLLCVLAERTNEAPWSCLKVATGKTSQFGAPILEQEAEPQTEEVPSTCVGFLPLFWKMDSSPNFHSLFLSPLRSGVIHTVL